MESEEKPVVIITGSTGLIGNPAVKRSSKEFRVIGFDRIASVIQPKHSLRDTIPAMVEFLKSDPAGFYRENKLDPPAWLRDAATPGGGRKQHGD